MNKYQTIEIQRNTEKLTAYIWLNRPEIRNAMNETMIEELIDAYNTLNEDNSVRIIVLRGKGKVFCSGADLNWMREVVKYGYEQSFKESKRLAQCFYTIYTSKKPTIALVHGAAIGGANGLMAACDIVYAAEDAIFSLSEVKIGLIPAAISPYVIKRIGEFAARELFLTGRRFNGIEAQNYRLVNKAVPSDKLDETLNETIDLLLTSGPEAMGHAKNLIFNVVNKLSLEEAIDFTADMIAKIRISEEGQEGMSAFLEKRKPKWIK